jgi:Ribbon-helix-helix protein, copG family
MYHICMKRINIQISEELAARLEELAEKKEMSVAEISRRSLENYLSRFPEKAVSPSSIPTFNLGKPRRKDMKEAIYRERVTQIGR